MIRRFFLGLIRFYQRWLSPLKRRPSCRFVPTCSEYAREAIERHGALRGGLRSVWRLLRCQPLCRGGYDPVDPDHRHLTSRTS
jgi:uncharacterized protein